MRIPNRHLTRAKGTDRDELHYSLCECSNPFLLESRERRMSTIRPLPGCIEFRGLSFPQESRIQGPVRFIINAIEPNLPDQFSDCRGIICFVRQLQSGDGHIRPNSTSRYGRSNGDKSGPFAYIILLTTRDSRASVQSGRDAMMCQSGD
jgi:hypothetical protein